MKQRHNIFAGKSLLFRLSVCRLLLFCCFTAFACSAFGDKVKQEGVLYKKSDMLAVGSMSKGKFVEGSRIKFYRVPDAYRYKVKKIGDDDIYLKRKRDIWLLSKFSIFADCIYYKENGEEYFKGVLRLDRSVYHGTFKFYNSLDATSFVHNSKDSSDKFFYHILSVDSAKTWVGDWFVSAERTEDGYFMRAKSKYDDYTAGTAPVAVEGILPVEDFNVEEINDSLIFFLDKLERAKIIKRNGDEFDGTVKIEMGNDWELNCKLLNGTYKYHETGDVFVGDYQEIYYDKDGIHVPTRGTTKFADGTSVTGDWLAGYNFYYGEWQEIYNKSNGPTDIRNNVIALKRQKDEEAAKERAKKEEERRREWQKEQRKRARRQYLINKYGYKYGSLLANGKICIGMTKEMVNEVWPRGCFVVSQLVLSGRRAEQWVFSEDKFALYCAQKEDKGSLIAYLFAKQLGMQTVFPEEMLFINGILRGLSQ